MLPEEVTLPITQFVPEAMLDGEFPLLENVKTSIVTRSDLAFGTKVPHNPSTRRSVKLPNQIDDVQISTDTGRTTGINKSYPNNMSEYNE
jgi:hypothetical protein